MTIWIVDNRVRRRGIKVSMTNRLIQALRVFSEDVRVIRNANEARRIRYGVVRALWELNVGRER